MEKIKLKKVCTKTVYPRAPYNFKYSTQNPSYFPTPTGENTDNGMWFTMRWKNRALGIRFKNKGTIKKPVIEVTVYARKKLDRTKIAKLLNG